MPASSTSYATIASVVYNTVFMVPFLIPSMIPEVFPGMKTEECSRRGVCAETPEFTCAKIYMQVIVAAALMFVSASAVGGKKGLLGAIGTFAAVQAKHITVDGLIPPAPVMVMTAGVLAAILFAPGEWGKRALVGYCCLNAFTFVTNPLMVVQDTWPSITEGSEAAKVSCFLLEVIALYMVMVATVVATPNRKLGMAYAWTFDLAILLKHVVIDKSGPPPPLIVLNLVIVALSWYEYGFANLKPAADKAMKEGPMKLHALVLGTAFVPMFALESVGISAPMAGLAAVDESYQYTGLMAMLLMMMTIFLAMVGWMEYTAKMEGKMFAMYHYFLSVAVVYWFFQPTTTTMGKVMFAAPLAFTAWCVYIVVTKDKQA
jgi:hypothetical protein